MVSRAVIYALFAGLFVAPGAGAAVPVRGQTLLPGVIYSRQIEFTEHGPVVLHVIAAPRPTGLYALKPILSNNAVPPGFIGLSIEYHSVPGYFGPVGQPDPVFVQLVRNLVPGQSPVLRFGGDTTDWTWAPTPGEMDGRMQSGDVILAPYGSGRAVALQNTGFPLKFVYPKEGAVALQVAACAVAENAQPQLSQQFVQYLLSPEVQMLQAQGIGLGPVNKTVKLTPDVAARVPYGPEQISKLTAVDWSTINQHRTEWTERWNRSVER